MIAPAFNEAHTIQKTVRAITEALDATGEAYELIVVSDGSSDHTSREALGTGHPSVRVIEYHPNHGKGHALRVGSQEARGRWVAWIDADLDLNPAMLANFLSAIRDRDLDAVVGSKRHPASIVNYPPIRRLNSLLYQGLVRALFGLKVRDTQVGMKIFRRDMLVAVLPRILVKRFAFDIEVLAVGHHLGYTRIEEHPVILTYQFSGSGLDVQAIMRALWDTFAIYYRLRIVRYYD